MINDRRTEEENKKTRYYVVTHDTFLSGWGECKGRSIFVVACDDILEVARVKDIFKKKPEFKRVRVNLHLPSIGVLDHLSICWCKNYCTY